MLEAPHPGGRIYVSGTQASSPVRRTPPASRCWAQRVRSVMAGTRGAMPWNVPRCGTGRTGNRWTDDIRRLSPRPEGEGRGEGEGRPLTAAPRVCPLLSPSLRPYPWTIRSPQGFGAAAELPLSARPGGVAAPNRLAKPLARRKAVAQRSGGTAFGRVRATEGETVSQSRVIPRLLQGDAPSKRKPEACQPLAGG